MRVVRFGVCLVAMLAGCTSTPSKATSLPQPGPEDIQTYRQESDGRLVLTLLNQTTQWLELPDGPVKSELRATIRKIAIANEDSLVRLLAAGDVRERIVAAGALGFTGDNRVVQPLVVALDSPTPEVVSNALFSLWLLASPDTPRGSLVAALSSPDARVRSNAAMALGAVVRPGETGDFTQPLIFLLQDTDDVARAEAAGALGRIGDREATPHLVKALSDRYLLIRLRAAIALGAIRDPAAVPALIQALADSSEKVRLAAHKALRATTGQDLPPDRAAWEKWASEPHPAIDH